MTSPQNNLASQSVKSIITHKTQKDSQVSRNFYKDDIFILLMRNIFFINRKILFWWPQAQTLIVHLSGSNHTAEREHCHEGSEVYETRERKWNDGSHFILWNRILVCLVKILVSFVKNTLDIKLCHALTCKLYLFIY